MIDVHTINPKKQRKYIDSYNTEEKIDWRARYKQKNKAKKVHRFLRACCKQKKKRK